jgi:hypothetical protein
MLVANHESRQPPFPPGRSLGGGLWLCQSLRMRLLTSRGVRQLRFPLLVSLALAAVGGSPAAGPLALVLTTNVAPAGFVEVTGVEAGEFNPQIWQADTLNFVPDERFPLLAPREGKFRNIYAPSAVEIPGGYRLFYGAWDGVPSGNDRIYSALADAQFQGFSGRHTVLEPGKYIHLCNVNALGFDDGSFALFGTLYPVDRLNKPAFFRSDTTGTNWNGLTGEPYTAQEKDIVEIDGYSYTNADINGMNVMLKEGGVYRLYFGDFRNPGDTFRATSGDGRHYRFDARVVTGRGHVNDVKKFLVGNTPWYLTGLHENGQRLWQTVSTNALAFPAPLPLATNLSAGDRYVVALGWVVRGAQEKPGRKLLGVLYGAGPVPALNENRIYGRWLQKRVVFAAREGTRFSGTKAVGPDRQLLAVPAVERLSGRFEIYAEDGVTLLGTSAPQTITPRQAYRLD